MKLMKTQGASDAMQMAHYKLTIIIIINASDFTRLQKYPMNCSFSIHTHGY